MNNGLHQSVLCNESFFTSAQQAIKLSLFCVLEAHMCRMNESRSSWNWQVQARCSDHDVWPCTTKLPGGNAKALPDNLCLSYLGNESVLARSSGESASV